MATLDIPGACLDIDALLALRHLVHRMPRMAALPGTVPGGRVQKPRGRGMEVADIRHFVDGDDVRLIDRNATARSGALHVKSVHDERDRTVLLLADFRPSMLWGTRRAFRSVGAAEALALIGWRAAEDGARIALLAFGAGEPMILPPRGRERGMIAVIGALAQMHREALAQEMRAESGMSADPPLCEALTLARRIAGRGSRTVLASALETPGDSFEAEIRSLDAHASLTVLRLRDPLESEPPRGLYRYRTPGGETGTVRLGDRHEDAIAAKLARWEVPVETIDAAMPPEAVATGLGALHV